MWLGPAASVVGSDSRNDAVLCLLGWIGTKKHGFGQVSRRSHLGRDAKCEASELPGLRSPPGPDTGRPGIRAHPSGRAALRTEPIMCPEAEPQGQVCWQKWCQGTSMTLGGGQNQPGILLRLLGWGRRSMQGLGTGLPSHTAVLIALPVVECV